MFDVFSKFYLQSAHSANLLKLLTMHGAIKYLHMKKNKGGRFFLGRVKIYQKMQLFYLSFLLLSTPRRSRVIAVCRCDIGRKNDLFANFVKVISQNKFDLHN